MMRKGEGECQSQVTGLCGGGGVMSRGDKSGRTLCESSQLALNWGMEMRI